MVDNINYNLDHFLLLLSVFTCKLDEKDELEGKECLKSFHYIYLAVLLQANMATHALPFNTNMYYYSPSNSVLRANE